MWTRELVEELVKLSPGEIKALPTSDFIKGEILAAHPLNGGARKRQIKFVAKELRAYDEDQNNLGEFLAQRKGSRIQEKEQFRELENLRQTIISEAIVAMEKAQAQGLGPPDDWPSSGLEQARSRFQEMDWVNLRILAGRYARSRKVALSREIFRQLKALQDKQGQELDSGIANSV